MRILHVANGFPPTAIAGVEQYTHALAHEQTRRHQVAVFCREYAPDLSEYTIRDEVQAELSIRRVVNNFSHVSSLETRYRNPTIEKMFRAYVQEMRPDVIHVQHCVGLSAGLLDIIRELGVPFVLTLHDYWYICPTTRLLTRDLALCSGPHHGVDCRLCLGPILTLSGWLHRLPFYSRLRDVLVPYRLQRRILAWIEQRRPLSSHPSSAGSLISRPIEERVRFMRSKLADVPLLAPSDFCRQVYVDFGMEARAVRVLTEGVDLKLWQNQPPRIPSEQFRFGYIGSLAAHKGVDVLVRAFRRLSEADVALSLFGAGDPDDPFVAHINELIAGDSRICAQGRYENRCLPELLASVDAVVVPSRWHETFSIVTREALLAGLPVIASYVGAIPEVISDGKNGLLVPPASEESLALALRRLAVDQELAARMARAARATLVKGVEEHGQEVEAVYNEVLSWGEW